MEYTGKNTTTNAQAALNFSLASKDFVQDGSAAVAISARDLHSADFKYRLSHCDLHRKKVPSHYQLSEQLNPVCLFPLIKVTAALLTASCTSLTTPTHVDIPSLATTLTPHNPLCFCTSAAPDPTSNRRKPLPMAPVQSSPKDIAQLSPIIII